MFILSMIEDNNKVNASLWVQLWTNQLLFFSANARLIRHVTLFSLLYKAQDKMSLGAIKESSALSSPLSGFLLRRCVWLNLGLTTAVTRWREGVLPLYSAAFYSFWNPPSCAFIYFVNLISKLKKFPLYIIYLFHCCFC